MESALPQHVQENLELFLTEAKKAFGDDLVNASLFGSAAEGRLRASSDVNLILVLKKFSATQVNGLREPLRIGHAAILLSVMFLLESELSQASDAFAMKFHDILDRHKVLHGEDVFKDLKISRQATLHRVRQVLMNFTLRLRERYALVSLREEHLMPVLADAVGPIRAAAATILDLEKGEHLPPKDALTKLCKSLPGNWDALLSDFSVVREKGELPPGRPGPMVLETHDLLLAMQEHLRKFT